MEATRKFRKNMQRVKRTKYAKLENKDKALKAGMTIFKIVIYGTLAIIALPLVIGGLIAIAFASGTKDVVQDATSKSTDWQGRTYYHKPYYRK